jgi:hypothetical protein
MAKNLLHYRRIGEKRQDDSEVIRRILIHLRRPASPPPLAKARIGGTPLAFRLDGELLALERVEGAIEAGGAGGMHASASGRMTGLARNRGAEREGEEEAG